MAIEDPHNILEYLKKQGSTNTFRLARALGVDRHEILKIIKTLKERGVIEFKSGIVSLPRFPREEILIKSTKVEKAPTQSKKEVKHAHRKGVVKERSKLIEDMQNEYKKIEIRLSKLEKQSSNKYQLFSNLKNQIDGLENNINELSKIYQKITRKTRLRRKAPIEVKKESLFKFKIPQIKLKAPKFEVPEFGFSRIKDIKNLAKSKVIKKIKMPRINFSGLKERIKKAFGKRRGH